MIVSKKVGRRQHLYVLTMNYCRLFIICSQTSWGWSFVVVKWMKIKSFTSEAFDFFMIFNFSALGHSVFGTFSFFPVSGTFGLQFWSLGAPIWPPCLRLFPFWGLLLVPFGSIWLAFGYFGYLLAPFGASLFPFGVFVAPLLPTFGSPAAPWSENLP